MLSFTILRNDSNGVQSYLTNRRGSHFKRLWPDLVTAVRIDQNSEWQKAGIDRLFDTEEWSFVYGGRKEAVQGLRRHTYRGGSVEARSQWAILWREGWVVT